MSRQSETARRLAELSYDWHVTIQAGPSLLTEWTLRLRQGGTEHREPVEHVYYGRDLGRLVEAAYVGAPAGRIA